MNAKNLDYLKDGLKYLGFGKDLHQELEKQLQKQAPGFSLRHQVSHYRSTMDYLLHFKRSEASGLYFFNKYEATLKPDESAQYRSQTFYINQNSGITAREAYNLLSGRAVHKELVNAEGQPYRAWLQLDPENTGERGQHKIRQFHDNYGFNLEKTLKWFAIKELSDPGQKEKLLRSLQKGNVQQVTALQQGQEVKRFIEASPRYKTINVFDEHLKPVKRETIYRQAETTERQGQSRQQERKNELPQQELTQRSPRRGLSL